MALHRDIFWIGRQWAVTGFGLQAVDQRLKGAFDVEASRLWEDDLPQRMRALAWINADDFNKALDTARGRFPQPPRKDVKEAKETRDASDEGEHRRHCGRGMVMTRSGCVAARRRQDWEGSARQYYRNLYPGSVTPPF